jgi:uncharacterized membrane protein
MPTARSEREARYEARREVVPAVAVAPVVLIALAIVSRAEGWMLLELGWWAWLVLAVPATVLCLDLSFGLRLSFVRTRLAAEILSGIVVFGNLVGVAVLVAALVTASGDELGGGQLLFTTATIWITNVIVFALWFWELDDGGPFERARNERKTPDFRFPQDADPEIAREGWRPRIWDYLYISATNSSAFSPTDEMPLTVHAKLLMGVESVLSLVLVVLVIARAVSALGS